MEQTPDGTNVSLVAPWGENVLVAAGTTWVKSGSGWTAVPIPEANKAVANGPGLLVATPGGVFDLAPDLTVTPVSRYPSAVPAVFRWKGNAYFWTEDGCYSYNAGMRRPAGEFPWGKAHPVFTYEGADSAVYLDDGRVYVASTGSFFSSPRFHRSVVGLAIVGSNVIVASYDEGLLFFSRTGDYLYSMPASSLGGSVTGVFNSADSILAVSGTSILSIPSPEHFFYRDVHSLSAGDLYPSGVRFVAERQVMSEDGRILGGPKSLADSVSCYNEEEDGTPIYGGFGWVYFGHKIPLWDRARDLLYVGALSSDSIVAWHDENDLVFVSKSGSFVRRSVNTAITSVAVKDGLAYVAGSDGIWVFDASGSVVRRFGARMGRMFVRAIHGGPLLAWSPQGIVALETGLIVKPVPSGGRLVDVCLFKGEPLALVQFPTESAVGRLAPWKPMTVPGLPKKVVSIAAKQDSIYFFAPRLVGKVDPLPFELPKVTLENRYLDAATDSVSFSLPASRMVPFPRYSYSAQIGKDVVTSTDGAFKAPRFAYGRTRVSADLSALGLHESVEFEVYRRYPWWLSWPGFVLYVGVASAGGLGIVRWRTEASRRRTQVLEALVAKRTAELQEAQRAREVFFSSMSHEIRNPLNGVMGLAEMLEESGISGRERVFLRMMKGCVRQLGSMLDDILDFSKMERGEVSLHEAPFDLNPTLEGAIRAVDASMSRVSLESGESVWLYGDEGKIRQVVTNLVSNALKYGVPQQARVTVEVNETPERDRRVFVRVYNTGPTIPPEDLGRIFDGVRGTSAIERRIGGYGLGLALSRRLAGILGGSLTASSSDGLTTFSFDFRCQVTAEPPQVADLSTMPEKVSKALVIEDENYNRLVLGGLLAKMGYEADWGVDLKGALERLRTGSYDVVITDYRLPDGTGIEFAKAVATLPEPRPPVVMVTAFSTLEKMQEARDAGIRAFVSKPVSFASLQKALVGMNASQMGHRSLDISRQSSLYDFTAIQRYGRSVMAQYGKDLEAKWLLAETAALAVAKLPVKLEYSPDETRIIKEAIYLAHTYRGSVLVIHASSLADDLALLEAALTEADGNNINRLLGAIRPQVESVVATIAKLALS